MTVSYGYFGTLKFYCWSTSEKRIEDEICHVEQKEHHNVLKHIFAQLLLVFIHMHKTIMNTSTKKYNTTPVSLISSFSSSHFLSVLRKIFISLVSFFMFLMYSVFFCSLLDHVIFLHHFFPFFTYSVLPDHCSISMLCSKIHLSSSSLFNNCFLSLYFSLSLFHTSCAFPLFHHISH